MTENELEIQFRKDLDDIASELIQSFGLKYSNEPNGVHDPLLRWIDFSMRYISQKERFVVYSNNFWKELPKELHKLIGEFSDHFEYGHDVNPYQSKGLIQFNDTSGNNAAKRTDLLWADWGIHHFHLTDLAFTNGEYFSPRSKWLLFAIVGEDFVGFIDVRNHNEEDIFSDTVLLQKVVDSWPDIMEQYRLKGFNSVQTYDSPKDIALLRKSGITNMVNIRGNTYCGPGLGLTTAGTASRSTMIRINIIRSLRAIVKSISDPNGSFQNKDINPVYSLKLSPKGLIIYNSTDDSAMIFPLRNLTSSPNAYTEISEIISPQWVIDFLNSKHLSIP
jgi:hypothetical protein